MAEIYKAIVAGEATATFTLTDNKRTQNKQGPLVWFVKSKRYESHFPDHDRLITEGYSKIITQDILPTQKRGNLYIVGGDEAWIEVVSKTVGELAKEEVNKSKLEWETLDAKITPRMIEDLYDFITNTTTEMPQEITDLMNERKTKRNQ